MNSNKLHRNPSLRSSFVRDTSYRMSPVFGYVPSCLIWLALFLLTGSVAFGSTTPTFIQERDNQVNSGKTSGVTLASPTTAGNLIVAYLIWDNTGSASVSDSHGNSYASAVAPTRWSNGKYSAQVFYTINLRGGVDTVTATFATAVSSFGIVYAHEYSGISQTAPVDVTAAAAAASGSLNSGSAATANATDLLFAGGVSANVVTSPGAGYMARAKSHGNMTEDRIVSSKGSYNATASNSAGAWAMQMVAFKGVSSGASSSATLQSVAVSPSNSSVSQSQTQQFTATGTYSDASTKNITTSVTWASSNTAVATIGANTGLATGIAAGTSQITAALGTVTSPSRSLTVVTSVTLQSITVSPSNSSVTQSQTQQFTATGTYGDGSTKNITTSVTWASSNTAVATIGANTGLATGIAAGTSQITATLGSVVSPNDTVTVAKGVYLQSIAVSPSNSSLSQSQTQQFTATGTYSDGSSKNITTSINWASSNAAVATIGANTGLATGISAGASQISASLGSITSPSSALAVTAATGNSYTTNFALTENPISEGGKLDQRKGDRLRLGRCSHHAGACLRDGAGHRGL